MIEFLIEFLGELFVQVVIEVLFELGLRTLTEPFKRTPNPWVAALSYVVFGAALGGLSLLVFPAHFVRRAHLRILNLLIAPIAAGLGMAAIGAWRARRGDAALRIDRFGYGYLFALALAAVRFAFGQ